MNNTINKLTPVTEVNALVKAGKLLLLSGEEAVLQQIEKGNWIGGTIPYFMDNDGGCLDKNHVFVTDLTDIASEFSIKQYNAAQLESMFADRFKDGFTYVMIPAFSEVHSKYSIEMRYLPSLFDVVTMGWVTGVHLENIGKQQPKTVNGLTGEMLSDCLVAMHCKLPAHQYADIEIINVYEQDENSPVFSFPADSFSATDCTINGTPANLAEYILANKVDTGLPLIADYSGALINTTIEKVHQEQKTVSFFAPMVRNQEYRFAKPMPDRYKLFAEKLPANGSHIVCSCNCIVNYLNLSLEGKKTADFNGPFTFGEIAYILLNQTMVLLSVQER